jgi:hypothetical protein
MTEILKIQKAESNPNTSDTRLRLGEVGNPFIQAVGGFIEDSKRRELQYPNSLDTFDKMSSNAAVSAGLTVGEVFLTKSLLTAKFEVGKANTQAAQDFADYLNWNIQNFVGSSWYDAITNIITFRKYGFSWLEKVFAKNDSIKWAGKYRYKYLKLAPRSQRSVREWRFDDPVLKRQLIGLYQWQPSTAIGQNLYSDVVSIRNMNDEYLRREKFMLFSWNSLNNNPQGKSDLVDCFKSWKELEMITSYEVVGVSKDLGGVLVLRVPNDHINKAAEDPNSDEARTLNALQKNAAAIHAGDQTYILLGSDIQGETGTGKYVYDIELKGVDGGSKSYQTSTLIDQRKKDILNVLGAGFVLLGQDGVGSYSLADSKTNLFSFYIQRMLMFISNVFSREFVKSLADINEIKLEQDEMPTLVFEDIDNLDPEVASKAGQRLGATGLFPKERSMLIQLWKQCGYDTRDIEKYSDEELINMLTPETTRAGDGMTEGMPSGTGSASGNNSSINMDNTA